jgi:small redox-active disulfide protein 2
MPARRIGRLWSPGRAALFSLVGGEFGDIRNHRAARHHHYKEGDLAMLIIKVLGSGCENCQKVNQAAHQAAASMGMEAKFEKITNYADIMKYPILSTPGLVINEKLVCAGRLPSLAEVTTWLADAAMQAA